MSEHNLFIESALPPRFVQNKTCEDGETLFSACCNGKKLLFEKDRIAIFKKSRPEADCPCVALRFVGAKENAPSGFLPQLSGGDGEQCCCETLPAYGMLKYTNVWEGVDLELSACESGLKMNWVLAEPKNVSSIRLRWEGALSLELDEEGALLIHHALGTLKDAPPLAWQVKNADVMNVACAYRLEGTDVLFELSPDCDENAPVVIDPLIQ